MNRTTCILMMMLLLAGNGCASNVRFVQTDESFVPAAKPDRAEVVLKHDTIRRPHRVVGVIEAELGRRARRPELDALLIKKAREIGADGVMLVEYDVDRDVYLDHHRHLVGRGPWRHPVVGTHKRVEVQKTASGMAVVFK